MEKNSKFQFIQTDEGRTIVRFYNEEKDCFEKICIAKKVELMNGSLLVTDGVYRLQHNGKLVLLGDEQRAAHVWQDTEGKKLLMFDTNRTPLSVQAVFVLPSGACYPVNEYKLYEDGVEIRRLDGKGMEYRLVNVGEQDNDGIVRFGWTCRWR